MGFDKVTLGLTGIGQGLSCHMVDGCKVQPMHEVTARQVGVARAG